jgi:hypothetical protein
MCGHIEVDDTPPFMRQHQKHVQHLETDRRHSAGPSIGGGGNLRGSRDRGFLGTLAPTAD